ncbi:MAG: hypothetical protein KatS3mg061_2949 [Dehalococcoidia bacterium]|nr:MAG: hypothetical protein KatS3mg061_2949 [Dehalococcoidia bacterium]
MRWWKNLSLRWKLLAGFATILVLVAGINAFAFRTTVQNNEASNWVEHTYQVMLGAKEAMTDLVNMETGYRGFLVTGREEFLQPYQAGSQDLSRHLGELQQLTADNPAQVARWKDIEARAAAWQREVAEPGIALRREVNAGTKTIQDVAVFEGSGRGKQHFDGIRAVFDQAITAERTLLQARTAASAAQSSLLLLTLVVGTVVAVVLGVALALFFASSVSSTARAVQRTLHSLAERDAASLQAALNAMAENDLTVPAEVVTTAVAVSGRDELGPDGGCGQRPRRAVARHGH